MRTQPLPAASDLDPTGEGAVLMLFRGSIDKSWHGGTRNRSRSYRRVVQCSFGRGQRTSGLASPGLSKDQELLTTSYGLLTALCLSPLPVSSSPVPSALYRENRAQKRKCTRGTII
jgi:hypothetical protein